MSWKEGRLIDVVTLKRGHDLPESLRVEGPIPVVSSSGVTGHHNVSIVEPPGIVTGRYGTLGEVFYVEEPYWPLNTALYAIDFHGNDPRFIAHFLKHVLGGARSDKAAVPGVNRNDLHEMPVRFPGLPTQERIASILKSYDDLIENNRRRIRLLEEAARLLYQEWFVRFRFPGHEHVKIVNGVPDGWEPKSFDEVCVAVGGGTPSTKIHDYWDGDVTWVVPTDVTRNGSLALLDSERKITDRGLRESSAQMLPPEAILMTSRASVGFFALPDAPVCTNQGFINIIPKIPACRFFLLHNLVSRVDEIRAHAAGSTYPEISKSRFRSLPVLLPPQRIREEFEDTVSASHGLVRNLELTVKKLKSARDLLLPRLMSGEVEV